MKRTLPLAAAFVLFFSAFIIDSKAASFTDLRATSPFYEEMMFLKNERIISGSSDSTFRPDEPVMRGQFSDFLARALDDRFKVEKPSYAMDQTKVYRYSADGMFGRRMKAVLKRKLRWQSMKTAPSYLTSEGPVSIVQLLKYPITEGQSWPLNPNGTGELIITSTTKTAR